jgi:hypothetical protein
MLTVHEWHVAHHQTPDLEVVDCPECRHNWRVCQRKRRFVDQEAADTVADQLNPRRRSRPLVSYRCRECRLWHLATARKKRDVRRAEKRRRKLLIAEVAS